MCRMVAMSLISALCCPTLVAGQQVPTFVTAGRPAVTIGVEDGAAPYLLSGVADATRLADGSIVIGNCSAGDLRLYDSRGVHLRTFGGRGRGPGEFEYLRRVFPAGGDSLAVYDGTPNRRINVFRANGDFVRSVRVPFSAEPIGRTADGMFVMLQPENYRSPRPTLGPGFHRRSLTIYKLNSSGELTDSLTGLPGSEVFVVAGDRVPERAPRLRRHTVVAVQSDRIIVGTQDKASFIELSSDLRGRVERPTVTQPLPVTAAVRRDWDAARSTMMPDGGVTPVYASEYAPATPAYRDLIAGNDGRVWLQDPELPGSYPLVWTAYADGRATARVELPVRFFPFEFGADWVLGVSYDDVGIERVQLFDLIAGRHANRKLSPFEAAPPNVPRCGSWTAR